MQKSILYKTKICGNRLWCKYASFSVPKTKEKLLQDAYEILNIQENARQEKIREAFLALAKKYHPDSGSPEANIDKFVAVEKAFRLLSKHNTGATSEYDIGRIVRDIRHTAPQHRQYLSYEGVGIGTPYQRQKQWEKRRAEKAAENVMEHRISKSIVDEHALYKKETYSKNHDIKTKYGFDRLVEDLIQEAMSKGEFDNLKGKGKPLEDKNINPYVDFTTHKLNEVLINNGFTPEWITMSREIDDDIEALKNEIKKQRILLGPYPLVGEDIVKWQQICDTNKELTKPINAKINKYNLIAPLISKQKFHVDYVGICKDILENGEDHTCLMFLKEKAEVREEVVQKNTLADDIFGIFIKFLTELLSFKKH